MKFAAEYLGDGRFDRLGVPDDDRPIPFADLRPPDLLLCGRLLHHFRCSRGERDQDREQLIFERVKVESEELRVLLAATLLSHVN